MSRFLTLIATAFLEAANGRESDSDVVDLDHHRFNDICIGTRSSEVRTVKKYEHFEMASLACNRSVEIGTESETVDYILIIWEDPGAPELPPFEGRIRFKGHLHHFTRRTTKEEILKLLGKPYWIDEDADEFIFFYEFGEIEWQVEFDEKSQLKVLLIATPPLLADEGQRKAYGVTESWPPGAE